MSRREIANEVCMFFALLGSAVVSFIVYRLKPTEPTWAMAFFAGLMAIALMIYLRRA